MTCRPCVKGLHSECMGVDGLFCDCTDQSHDFAKKLEAAPAQPEAAPTEGLGVGVRGTFYNCAACGEPEDECTCAPGASLAAKLATMEDPMYPPKATAERMARFVEKHDGCSTCGAPRPCAAHPAPAPTETPAGPREPSVNCEEHGHSHPSVACPKCFKRYGEWQHRQRLSGALSRADAAADRLHEDRKVDPALLNEPYDAAPAGPRKTVGCIPLGNCPAHGNPEPCVVCIEHDAQRAPAGPVQPTCEVLGGLLNAIMEEAIEGGAYSSIEENARAALGELARLRAENAALAEKLVLLEEGKARGHKINEKQKAQLSEKDRDAATLREKLAEAERDRASAIATRDDRWAKHKAAEARADALAKQMAEKEGEIAELKAEVEHERDLRGKAYARIDKHATEAASLRKELAALKETK